LISVLDLAVVRSLTRSGQSRRHRLSLFTVSFRMVLPHRARTPLSDPDPLGASLLHIGAGWVNLADFIHLERQCRPEVWPTL